MRTSSGGDAMEKLRCAWYPSSAVSRTSTCCPARWPGQSGTSSTSVRALGVSVMTSTTVASRQAILGTRDGTELPRGSPVTSVSLLTPRVSIVVIAKRFPESGPVVLHETQLPHPLRAFPEIEMRYQEARGAAVLGRERRTIVVHRHPCLAAGHVR